MGLNLFKMNKEENQEEFIVEVAESTIDKNCYTLTEFAKYLTDTYKKSSGADFTPHEGKEFVRRGKLPEKYGGHKLEYIKVTHTGIKFVRIIKEPQTN